METNGEKLLRILGDSAGPLCDDCATALGDFRQRQIVYQEAERLAGRGDIRRGKGVGCARCGQYKKCSWIGGDTATEGGSGAIGERGAAPTSGQLSGDAARATAQVDKQEASEEAKAMTAAAAFEAFARDRLSEEYGVRLTPRGLQDVPKLFDFVSPNGKVVGDAKFYSLVNGTSLPPAKFSVIAEHVWLLEHTGAEHLFLVFGNDRRVPQMWLDRYGGLVQRVKFYFLNADGTLEVLKE